MWWLSSVGLAATVTVPGEFATVADALQNVEPGDTVRIEEDITESVTVNVDVIFEGATSTVTWNSTGNPAISVEGLRSVTVQTLTFDGQGSDRAIEVVSGGTLTVLQSTFENHFSDAEGGALWLASGSTLTVEDSTFAGNSATSGGHIWIGSAAAVTIARSRFTGGVTSGPGGALVVQDSAGNVVLTGNHFEQNSAGLDAGAASFVNVSSLNLGQNLFCENSGGGDGGAVFADASIAVATGNVFARNDAMGNGGAVSFGTGSFSSNQNHFVANVADTEGGALYLSAGGTHVNNLIAHNQTVGLSVVFVPTGEALFQHTLYFDNEPRNNSVVSDPEIEADPLFVGDVRTGCEVEDLVPSLGSPAIDAGDPGVTDYDGTDSNIGAFGGAQPYPADVDQDGATLPDDCNDFDDTVLPGAPEQCNGIDDDCDGLLPADELDTDNDGQSGCQGDCDDNDAATFLGAPEIPADNKDQSCDGIEVCYFDGDNDGVGIQDLIPGSTIACDGEGESPFFDDCNDRDERMWPGNDEIECNNIDDDCSVLTLDCPDGAGSCGCAGTGGVPGVVWVSLLGLMALVRRQR